MRVGEGGREEVEGEALREVDKGDNLMLVEVHHHSFRRI